MMNTPRRQLMVLAVGSGLVIPAWAQSGKNLRLIVPFTPGGKIGRASCRERV